MKKLILTGGLLLSLLWLVAVSFFVPAIFAAGPQPPSAPTGGGNASAACLECHGPFEKLASAPPYFVAPSGEKINPHRFVPHDLKDIPDCVSCHKAHSATPTSAELAALPKPNVNTCFECHHKRDFVNCQSCHKRD
jgi:hypothetical protein